MKALTAVLVAAACLAHAETIDVPAGQTRTVDPGRRFTGGVLVKTGAGELDLTGAELANAGLEIREGTVRLRGGGTFSVTTRFVRFDVHRTRPAKKGPPEFADSGAQFSEFRLYNGGKPVPFPEGTKAIEGPVGSAEGPDKAIDGNVRTKFYNGGPLVLDLGREVSFDAYSFATANDAIGRDPAGWAVSAGTADGSHVKWRTVGSVADFTAPKERFAEAGRLFSLSLCDVVPVDYPVTVCGKGRLALSNVNEMLERVDGNGLIELDNASLVFAPSADFAGSVCGGNVTYRR